MARSHYVLTPNVKSRMEHKGLTFKCERCGKPIKNGEDIVSLRSEGYIRRFFHRACWNQLFF